jgi:alpha-tubulin suppressor-like RCC1 family protein
MKTRKLILHFLLSIVLLIMALNLSCTLATGYYHTVGITEDGTVVAVGNNDYGQCNVGGWTNIVQVAAGCHHTVGITEDGTVVAVGNNEARQCNVGGWTGIAQVAAGGDHTVGLKEDGTVVAVGYNKYGQCNVGGWTGIAQVAAGGDHTVGLKSDDTVVAVGYNEYGQCNVGSWTEIVLVTAGRQHTVGLKDDGTVVAVGDNEYKQCNVGSWTEIRNVAAGGQHTVGLKDDGTVVAVGDNEYGQCNVAGWKDIALVAAGYYHTVGLRGDGTVVAVGNNDYGQCDVYDWILAVPPLGVVDAKEETVTDGTVDAKDEADTEVVVDGTATVTVAQYADNPQPPSTWGDYSRPPDFAELGKYIDVYVLDTTEVNAIEIRLYYTAAEVVAAKIDEESLRLFWWNEPAWVQCSNSGVNTVSDYIWAIITENTTPRLSDLQGTEFGGYGHPTEFDGCGCFIATAAYGTDTAKEIDILREFRDEVLLLNNLGARFVSVYYETSPPIANFICQHEILRTAVRVGLVDPIVAILNWTEDLWSAKD